MGFNWKVDKLTARESVVMGAGATLEDSGGQNVLPSMQALAGYGNTWFVDSTLGGDTNDGKSWGSAFATIAAAVAAAAAGDTIYLRGSFTESVTVSLAGLSLIGAGTTPRNAAYWNPEAGNDKVNLTINAQHVMVSNVYFRPGARSSTYSACIVLGTGASHARIIGNRFQGSTGAYYAIYAPATGADNVHILGNQFVYFNTATYGTAIKTAQASPWNAYSAWQIESNEFNSCINAIVMQARVCRILGNTINEGGVNASGAIAAILAKGISLSGNGAECGGNIVCGNQLGGTYSATLYVVAAATDQWAGNWNVISGGITAANPA